MYSVHVSRVYPRECGATKADRTGVYPDVGLSPRVRGNRTYTIGGADSVGSIPASAGQPYSAFRDSCVSEVYPRECGATG